MYFNDPLILFYCACLIQSLNMDEVLDRYEAAGASASQEVADEGTLVFLKSEQVIYFPKIVSDSEHNLSSIAEVLI